jgi:hypothetical protein
MADTIDPVTGKVVLNLITRTHVSRMVLQSLLTVLIRSNPQLAEMVVEDLEKRKQAARQPEMREYLELAAGEVMSALAAVRAS